MSYINKKDLRSIHYQMNCRISIQGESRKHTEQIAFGIEKAILKIQEESKSKKENSEFDVFNSRERGDIYLTFKEAKPDFSLEMYSKEYLRDLKVKNVDLMLTTLRTFAKGILKGNKTFDAILDSSGRLLTFKVNLIRRQKIISLLKRNKSYNKRKIKNYFIDELRNKTDIIR